MSSTVDEDLNGRDCLARMIVDIEKNGYRTYMEQDRDGEIRSALDFYFDHLVPFVKMLGNDYECELSNTMRMIQANATQIPHENWIRSKPVLEKAMDLLA